MSAERLIEDSLNDILEAARKAIEFVDEIDSVVLADDDKTEYAVIRALEIVGEAARRIPYGCHVDESLMGATFTIATLLATMMGAT